jgi:hypothetical protein
LWVRDGGAHDIIDIILFKVVDDLIPKRGEEPVTTTNSRSLLQK